MATCPFYSALTGQMAAELKAEYPVVYGACFAAALAITTGCPVLTGDKEFREFGAKVEVDWIGSKT